MGESSAFFAVPFAGFFAQARPNSANQDLRIEESTGCSPDHETGQPPITPLALSSPNAFTGYVVLSGNSSPLALSLLFPLLIMQMLHNQVGPDEAKPQEYVDEHRERRLNESEI